MCLIFKRCTRLCCSVISVTEQKHRKLQSSSWRGCPDYRLSEFRVYINRYRNLVFPKGWEWRDYWCSQLNILMNPSHVINHSYAPMLKSWESFFFLILVTVIYLCGACATCWVHFCWQCLYGFRAKHSALNNQKEAHPWDGLTLLLPEVIGCL